MSSKIFASFLSGLWMYFVIADQDVSLLKIRMKNAVSKRPDNHVCSTHKLDSNDAYIVRFEPVVTSKVHHMELSGCTEPWSTDDPYWECEHHEHYCKTEHKVFIYVWAMNGTARSLPEGVGYHIGGKSNIKYLIIAMHYKDKFGENQRDDSGFNLYITNKRQPFQVGYYILGATGVIPPMAKDYHADTECQYEEDEVLYPIMYRTHSHNLGVVSSGYRIRNGIWAEIGRMSPQLPQSFYDVTVPGLDIKRGDYLVARCTMQSNRKYSTSITRIGDFNKEEMCKFFIMFYKTTGKQAKKMTDCFKDHAKYKLEQHFTNIPKTISSIYKLPQFHMNDPYENDKE